MAQFWMNWCRLCATQNAKVVNLFENSEDQEDLVSIISKHLMLTITQTDEAPTSICDNCQKFILEMSQFARRSEKAESMFNKLIIDKEQYGLLDDTSIQKVFLHDKIHCLSSIIVKSEAESDNSTCDDIEYNPFVDTDLPTEKSVTAVPLLHADSSNMDDTKIEDTESGSETVKSNKPMKYLCNVCNKVYRTQQTLKKHKQLIHGESLFVCSVCSQTFMSWKLLKTHERSQHPAKEKPLHICPYCDKQFTTRYGVQLHYKAIHFGEKPYVCEECGKSFINSGALKMHQTTHSDDCPHQCPVCPKKFKTLYCLRNHEDTHKDSKYICPDCGIELNTKRTLRMHMVVHSDQKKYKCNFCSNEYKRAKTLKIHLLLHSGLQPYLCPFCDKTFASGANCRSHKKKAHPEQLAAIEAAGEVQAKVKMPKINQLQLKVGDDPSEYFNVISSKDCVKTN